jgi:hypothetical protein
LISDVAFRSDDESAAWAAHADEAMPTDTLRLLARLLARADAAHSVRSSLHSNDCRTLAALLSFVANGAKTKKNPKN